MMINKRGFTIVEVLIAVVMIALTIVSITLLVVDTIGVNATNLKNFQAAQLSQEGLEIVRNMRDSNWMRNLDWFASASTKENGAYFPLAWTDANADPVAGKSAEGNEDSPRGFYFTVDHNPNYASFTLNSGLGKIPEAKVQPWILTPVTQVNLSERARLYLCSDPLKPLFVHDREKWGCEKPSLFNRYIVIEPYKVKEYGDRPLMVRVRSVTEWQGRSGVKRVELVEELTDWRRSAL